MISCWCYVDKGTVDKYSVVVTVATSTLMGYLEREYVPVVSHVDTIQVVPMVWMRTIINLILCSCIVPWCFVGKRTDNSHLYSVDCPKAGSLFCTGEEKQLMWCWFVQNAVFAGTESEVVRVPLSRCDIKFKDCRLCT